MEAHEVMRDVLKRTSAKHIAAELGVSLSLVYKWAEPPEDASGSGRAARSTAPASSCAPRATPAWPSG